MVTTNSKYGNVNAAEVNAELATTSILKELAEDFFASEALETFLTVVIPEGDLAVIVISMMSCYRQSLEWRCRGRDRALAS